MAVRDMCNATVVDLSVDSTTILNAPAYLLGIYVNTVLSAHTVALSDAASAVFTLPVSLAAGTKLNFEGAKFNTSLVVTANAASTGSITVLWAPA